MAIKTLHLTNYWHERSGGVATFYRYLMEAANRRQRPMILVVPGAQDEIQEVGAHCRIYRIATSASPLNPEYRTIYPREFLLPTSKVQRILSEERPDLVEICDKYSLVHLGSLLRMRLAYGVDFRPAVVGLTCECMSENFASYISRADWGQAFARFYMRHVYFPSFDHHIAVSQHTARELHAVADGHMVPRGVFIRPMGVDVDHFSPSKRCPEFRRWLRERCHASESEILLLYVGRLVPEKNLELLIATMAELENSARKFRLLLAGEGISRKALERAANQQVPGQVVFMGHQQDRDALACLYANCDLFVHPNPAEPFGIAPLEAMASGLPLVAPDRGGITAYANQDNAYLAAPTPEGFARMILLALRAQKETAQKVKAAQQTAQSLAWPTVADSFLRLYEDLHRIGLGQECAENAAPAFISSDADSVRAACLSCTSKFAQTTFRFYVGVHRWLHGIRFNKKNHYQTKLEDIRTQ